MDYLSNLAQTENVTVGRPIILASSFTGGPRAMLQKYQDTMTICRKYGKPDLFITKTCNPKWQIQNSDIVSKVMSQLRLWMCTTLPQFQP